VPPWTSRYSRHRRSPVALATDGTSAEFRPLQGIAAAFAACLRSSAAGLERTQCLPGVWPPTAYEDRRVYVTFTRAFHARYVPSPGFLTLLTASSAPTPPGLFHPGNAPGVQPFRAFSSRGAAAPSDARCPPDVPAADPTRSIRPMSSRVEPWPERAVHQRTDREPGRAAFRALLPSGARGHPAVV